VQTQTMDISLVESVAKSKRRLIKTEIFINSVLIVLEHVLFILAFLFFYQWRVSPDFVLLDVSTWTSSSNSAMDYVFLLTIIHLIYTVLSMDKGLFHLYRQSNFIDDIFSISKAVFIALMIAIGILFILKTSVVYSRILIMGYAISIVFIASAIRAIKIAIIIKYAKNNGFIKRVLIIGAGKMGEQVANFIKSHRSSGYNVVGLLDDMKKGNGILGSIKDLEAIINSKKINEIYITIPSEKEIINKVLASIRKYDVDIKVIPEMYDFVSSSVKFQKNDAFPYMQIVKTPLRGLNLLLKRTVDITLSLMGIMLLSPLLIIIGYLIAKDSKGSVFFKQKRIGKNGVPFNMYKFRSMVVNAEELKANLEQQNEANGPVFKIKEDPRITKIGKFIRKYSIDELPQLFNVLKGEMSLIGPRPPLPNEVEKYDDYHWRRLDITPGISGLWQVSGRSDLSFDEWVNLDIYYIENWSIGMDIKILLRTIPVVFLGKGAY
jgi:exopolysaccharide biosynthesis polyprenyl glycosylphosphotransferase